MRSDDLFPAPSDSPALWGPCVSAHPSWLPSAQANALQQHLTDEVPWTVHRIRMFGRWVDSPRLSCWMGDPEATYRYSGANFAPEPWHPAIRALLPMLQESCGAAFNSVLLNRYRDGSDSMGWHSDDEPELGRDPVIASLSLGAERRFLMRLKSDHTVKQECRLRHGDLLVMRGEAQRLAQHALPKMAGVKGERINLTFRWVRSSA